MKRLALILMVFFVSTGDVFAQEAVRAAPAFQKNAAPQLRMNTEPFQVTIGEGQATLQVSNGWLLISGGRFGAVPSLRLTSGELKAGELISCLKAAGFSDAAIGRSLPSLIGELRARAGIKVGGMGICQGEAGCNAGLNAALRNRYEINDFRKMPYKPLPGVCLPVELKVAKTVSPGDPNVYPSIQQALAAADEAKYCAVKIVIGSGTYTGDLFIGRPTTLVGQFTQAAVIEGRISNASGHRLSIESLTVRGAANCGIDQQMGEITLKNVVVSQTKRDPGNFATGVGIKLHGGVKADLTNVALSGNEGTALYIYGHDTVVKGSNVTVSGNRIHPLAVQKMIDEHSISNTAAVEVALSATLLLDGFAVHHNEIAGVLVRDNGKAHLRNGFASDTSGFNNPGDGTTYGGNNLMSSRGGILEIDGFQSYNAAACGIRMYESYLQCRNGEVHHDVIGACLGPSPEDSYDAVHCILDNVRYYENGMNLDAETLPVPNPACSSTDPPPECSSSYCPGVPWF